DEEVAAGAEGRVPSSEELDLGHRRVLREPDLVVRVAATAGRVVACGQPRGREVRIDSSARRGSVAAAAHVEREGSKLQGEIALDGAAAEVEGDELVPVAVDRHDLGNAVAVEVAYRQLRPRRNEIGSAEREELAAIVAADDLDLAHGLVGEVLDR